MAGIIKNIVPKRVFDFGKLALSTTQSLKVCERIEASGSVDAVLVVRVHAVAIDPLNSIAFSLYDDGFTPNDPGNPFTSTNPGLSADPVTLDSTSVPGDSIANGGAVPGTYIGLKVDATRGASGSNVRATVSIDVVLKSDADATGAVQQAVKTAGGAGAPTIPLKNLDFSDLDVGATQDVILADLVDVRDWQETSFGVQVHDHSLASGAGSIAVMVIPQSFSEEDPSVTFLGTLSAQCQAIIDGSTPSQAHVVSALPLAGLDCMCESARIVARGTRVALGSMTAKISGKVASKNGASVTPPPNASSTLMLWGYTDDTGVVFDTSAPSTTIASVPQHGSLSGNWAQGTKSQQPFKDSLNGRVSAHGGGATGLVRTGTSDIKFLHDGTGCTVIAVVRPTDAGLYGSILDCLNQHAISNVGMLLFRTPADQFGFSVGNGSSVNWVVNVFLDGNQWLPIGETHVVWVHHSSNGSPNWELGFDYQVAASGSYLDTPSALTASTDLHWGAVPTFDSYAHLPEIAIYNEYQSQDTIFSHIDWLKSRWG